MNARLPKLLNASFCMLQLFFFLFQPGVIIKTFIGKGKKMLRSKSKRAHAMQCHDDGFATQCLILRLSNPSGRSASTARSVTAVTKSVDADSLNQQTTKEKVRWTLRSCLKLTDRSGGKSFMSHRV